MADMDILTVALFLVTCGLATYWYLLDLMFREADDALPKSGALSCPGATSSSSLASALASPLKSSSVVTGTSSRAASPARSGSTSEDEPWSPVLPTFRRWIEPAVLKRREHLLALYAQVSAPTVEDPEHMGRQDRLDDKLLRCQVPLTPFGPRLDIHLPSRDTQGINRPQRTLYFRRSGGNNAGGVNPSATPRTDWESAGFPKRHASFHAGVGAGTTPDWHTWMNEFANAAAARGSGKRIHEQPVGRSPYEGFMSPVVNSSQLRNIVRIPGSSQLLRGSFKSNSSLADDFRSNASLSNFDFQELKQPPTSPIMAPLKTKVSLMFQSRGLQRVEV